MPTTRRDNRLDKAMTVRKDTTVKNYAPTVLPDEVFDQFIEACETLSEPNQALRDAVSDAREQGFLNAPEEGATHS